MVTAVPTAPCIGLKLVMVGTVGLLTWNGNRLMPVPPLVLTLITPEVAVAGTTASIVDGLRMFTVVAMALLKDTDSGATKLFPVMVTKVPVGPLLGVKFVIWGVPVVIV